MRVHEPETLYDWWESLKHGGLLIAPTKLAAYFPETLPPLSGQAEERLRRDLTRCEGGDEAAVTSLLDTVLEEVLGLGQRFQPETGTWLKGNAVPATWTQRAVTGEAVKPRRVWQGSHGATFPVFVEDTPRLGVGRGRRAAARVVEWLRRAHHKVALLTNVRQWRIVHAGLDHDAYVEADNALWFTEGHPGPQVTALRIFLSPAALTPGKPGGMSPLLQAIESSRKGQAELSAVLGERVRQAVELLIREHGAALESLPPNVAPRHIYLAATRMVMRMVIVLFAEARDLLPRDNPVYYGSYSLGGLREALDRVGGGAGAERLRHHYGAWPRILALFRLVHAGSPHEALPVLRYGGSLFAAGDSAASDSVQRAMAVFEHAEHAPSDAVVHRMLELLTKSRVRLRQGRGATWVEAPVDFSDLSSEYIGILYEGLLDYELHRVAGDDSVIFLALGDEPALPLSRLEAMSKAALAALVEKSKQQKRPAVTDDAEDDTDGDNEDVEAVDEEDAEAEEEADTTALTAEADEGSDDRRQVARTRALTWARRAVEAGRLVSRPRSRRTEALREYDTQVAQAAEQLVARIILPGEWYLVRFGGTRKGFGTFYTRPQLAVPTVQRTLRPLAYDPPIGVNGQPHEDAPAAQWTPKRPEEILRLKVCDPAMGSGSFLVAALRFLTDALFASLHAHGRIQAQDERALVTLVEGTPAQGLLMEESLKCRPDDDAFEGLLDIAFILPPLFTGVDPHSPFSP
jgi:hypothetical protein